MRGTESVAVMKQRWIYHDSRFCLIQKVQKIVQMAITSTYSISLRILIQDEQLSGWKPPLENGIKYDLVCALVQLRGRGYPGRNHPRRWLNYMRKVNTGNWLRENHPWNTAMKTDKKWLRYRERTSIKHLVEQPKLESTLESDVATKWMPRQLTKHE